MEMSRLFPRLSHFKKCTPMDQLPTKKPPTRGRRLLEVLSQFVSRSLLPFASPVIQQSNIRRNGVFSDKIFIRSR